MLCTTLSSTLRLTSTSSQKVAWISHRANVIAFAAESQCQYLQALAFPDVIEVGLRVGKLGNSSVRYELAIFKQGETFAAAAGYFVHVFVDRQTRRPVPMPERIRAALGKISGADG